jgi:hypothetical protein
VIPAAARNRQTCKKLIKIERLQVGTEYTPKTAAVIEIMQQLGVGRSIVEKRMTELESSGKIRFVDDPRDSRKKLISRQDIETVIRALTP